MDANFDEFAISKIALARDRQSGLATEASASIQKSYSIFKQHLKYTMTCWTCQGLNYLRDGIEPSPGIWMPTPPIGVSDFPCYHYTNVDIGTSARI